MSCNDERSIAELTAEIETLGKQLGGEYCDYEQIAISILDARFDDFPEGELQRALETYLRSKAIELGVSYD